jgi:hypothetical protein
MVSSLLSLLLFATVTDATENNGQCKEYGRPPLATLEALMSRRKVKPIPTFFENFVGSGDHMIKVGHLPQEAQPFVDGAKQAYRDFKNPEKRFVSMSEREVFLTRFRSLLALTCSAPMIPPSSLCHPPRPLTNDV